MSNLVPHRVTSLRSLIEQFLKERLDAKLEKLKVDANSELEQVVAQFKVSVWLEDAARRVIQIQAVTHSLKPIHPDAKGSSLYCEPAALTKLRVVGSHVLGTQFDVDVVGNAAALDVYKFLKLSLEGDTLLELCLCNDADLAAALNEDPTTARRWMAAFGSLADVRGNPTSHTQAKQVFWLLEGEDPHDSASFHLLAPLFPTSLVHRVYQQVQADRFSDQAKAAREARKKGEFSDRPVRDYPQMAVQKLGGTKPQNISQLNSERRGDNFLFASLPPLWKTFDARAVLNAKSLFKAWAQRREVWREAQTLRKFLASGPPANALTRERVTKHVDNLIDDLLCWRASLQNLEPGWSMQEGCQLPSYQALWMDPPEDTDTNALSQESAAEQVAEDFARWLNEQLREQSLPVGSDEFIEWKRRAIDQFKDNEREAA